MAGSTNRPFPRSLVPLFQNESECETFQMKMSSACSFILMQIKAIFITMVSHLDSLWNRGTRELGNDLLTRPLHHWGVPTAIFSTTFYNHPIGYRRFWVWISSTSFWDVYEHSNLFLFCFETPIVLIKNCFSYACKIEIIIGLDQFWWKQFYFNTAFP